MGSVYYTDLINSQLLRAVYRLWTGNGDSRLTFFEQSLRASFTHPMTTLSLNRRTKQVLTDQPQESLIKGYKRGKWTYKWTQTCHWCLRHFANNLEVSQRWVMIPTFDKPLNC